MNQEIVAEYVGEKTEIYTPPLRSVKVLLNEARIELQGRGGRVRKIQVLHADALKTLDLSRRLVYLTEQPGRLWKDGLERRVRQAGEALAIRRRGVHGFRATRLVSSWMLKRLLATRKPRPAVS